MVFVNEAKPLRHNPGIGGKVKIPVFSTCVSLELQTHTTKITMTEPQHDFNHDHAHTVVVVLLVSQLCTREQEALVSPPNLLSKAQRPLVPVLALALITSALTSKRLWKKYTGSRELSMRR